MLQDKVENLLLSKRKEYSSLKFSQSWHIWLDHLRQVRVIFCIYISGNFPSYRILINITTTKINCSKVNITKILLGKFGGPTVCASSQNGYVILTICQSRSQDQITIFIYLLIFFFGGGGSIRRKNLLKESIQDTHSHGITHYFILVCHKPL